MFMDTIQPAEQIKFGKAIPADLINYFLTKENMSHKKIQKLAYYAQAWSVTLNNADIIEGIEFEAWVHGPVNKDIWHICKDHGWREIMISPDYRDEVDMRLEDVFSEDQIKILELVWDTYGGYTANELETLTHNEDPWLKAREGLDMFERTNRLISRDDMKEYYINFYE